ncbi:MAG TPA: winged helix-turn-helix domain-containing protein [Dyella sp.]|uniref:winged helix-turn-helix domain-containing protein n=1 Tax=Dyella sp. TaxID=1869338 RepID=UPI002D78769A|nr:winged helix-turn-helix domain-containing protein [Dyella sp.]HET6553780.1 winged helix-turn-helix domain-containing protein [Dyella sp.]
MAQSLPDSGWIYQCDDIVVEPRAHRLERAGVELSVEPKAYAVLVALLQQPGEVVGKDALLDAAWGHRHVTPGVLTRVISQLRHALGDSAASPRYIATVHTVGYRFIGEVQKTALITVVPAPAVTEVPAAKAALPAKDTPARKPPTPGLHWVTAAITVAVIVAMLVVASLWHPTRATSALPHASPQPALVVMPFAHENAPHASRPRHAPRYRRVSHFSPSTDEEAERGSGYLSLRPEQAPAARQ